MFSLFKLFFFYCKKRIVEGEDEAKTKKSNIVDMLIKPVTDQKSTYFCIKYLEI